MSKGCEIHVISNTHWDREWLFDFQETRMMLVEFLDLLLGILDSEPRYRAFLLDSQSVPLEDYLEIRPEARERVMRHVTDGRLWVGPWYTCPEGFIVNGESLVRNLLYGHRVAGEFGKVLKVGHTPFSYGQNSQMPQIYAGFGIGTILFYHGVSHEDVENEFIFEGADGTRILGSQMSSFARYNAYFHLYRPMVYGTSIDERMHTWTKQGLPFHLATEEGYRDHHLLLDVPKTYHRERLAELLKVLRDKEADTATTRYLAFMMGHDSSVPDLVEVQIIADGKELLPGDTLIHSTLPDWIEKVKKNVKDLTVLKGERRIPKMMGGRLHLYSDVLSSRTRVKRLNAKAELALQRRAEPLATLGWVLGAEYPARLLDQAWKFLLQSHAHDSIAGSGVDEIEKDVTYRLRQATNIAKGVASRGLQTLQRRIDNSNGTPDDIFLTVFNPSPFSRTEVVTAVVDLPLTSDFKAFEILDEGKGISQPVQISTRKPHHAVVNHAGDAPAMMECEQVRFHFLAKDIPALGYTVYRLVHSSASLVGTMTSGVNSAENGCLTVQIGPWGNLVVYHMASGQIFDDLHTFEDGGEAGHAWMHIEPALDRILSNVGLPAQVAVEEDGPLLVRYRIDYQLKVPKRLEENGGDPWQRLDGSGNSASRSEETCELKITSYVTLRRGAPFVEITTRFVNTARNHRLRVMFPTKLETSVCHAESAFDVVEREIDHGPESPWYGGVNATFPMHRFVDISEKEAGIAIINDGLREYQVTENYEHAIALTLMRAYEVSLTTVSKRWDPHPEMTLSQCPGEHEFRYWIYPHVGGWDQGDVMRAAEVVSVPLEIVQAGTHGGDLPKQNGFLSIEPSNLVLTALKHSEQGGRLVMRFYNPADKTLKGKIKTSLKVKSVHLLTLEEKEDEKLEVKNNSVSLKVEPKKIVTLGMDLAL